jgi:glycerate kinase
MRVRILAAPDKFRGTATAPEVARAVAAAARSVGASCEQLPLSDGGEGLLDAFGGANRTVSVTGPAGVPVAAGWRLDDDLAIIEAAQANGLLLAGGAERNDPMAATSAGVAELIRVAADAGARRVLVGVGGSATTDGGASVAEALEGLRPLDGTVSAPRVEVCCDVATTFVDAARVFAPQKGANPEQVRQLTDRLQTLAARYRDRYGVDVTTVRGSGAAGGLAGGLAALGAVLVSGFETIAAALDVESQVAGSDLVVTGEGRLDETSFQGKVVGGMVGLAERHNKPVLIVAGQVAIAGHDAVSLTDRCGADRSNHDTIACIEQAVREYLMH